MRLTCAYLPQTTFPPLVTRPSSLIFTSSTVPWNWISFSKCFFSLKFASLVTNLYLCYNSKICVHRTWWILLDSNNWKTECSFEFRMGHVSFVHPQTHGSNEPFKLGRFSGEIISNKSNFCHHPLPTFPFCFTRLENFEHFSLRLSSEQENPCEIL